MHIEHRALKITAKQRANAVRRYASGVPAQQVGRELGGVKGDTVAKWVREAGLKVRGRAESQRLRASFFNLDTAAIVTAFKAGASVLRLATKYDVSRNVIVRHLAESGIRTRGRSDAETIKWRNLRRKPEAIRRQMSAAWAARSGGARLSGRTSHGSIGFYEVELLLLLRERHGLPFTHQFVIETGTRRGSHNYPGRYYLDLALEESSIAVEVCRSWSKGPRGSLKPQRLEYLFDRGWSVLVLYVPVRRTPVNLERLAQYVVAFVKLARRNKAPRGQYGMIDRYGEPMTMLGLDLDHRPRVEGF